MKWEPLLIVEDPGFDANRAYNFANPMAELHSTEAYVTPSGVEAVITTSRVVFREDFVCMEYTAQFVLHQASFSVRISVDEGKSGGGALTLLKEILDAYE